MKVEFSKRYIVSWCIITAILVGVVGLGVSALIKERNDYKHSYIKALKLRNLQVKVLSKSMDMHSLSMSFATQVNEECDVVDEIYDCFREDYDSLKKEVRNYLKEANKFNEEYYEREN